MRIRRWYHRIEWGPTFFILGVIAVLGGYLILVEIIKEHPKLSPQFLNSLEDGKINKSEYGEIVKEYRYLLIQSVKELNNEKDRPDINSIGSY